MVDTVGCGVEEVADYLSDSLLDGEDFNITLPNFSGDDYTLPAKTGGVWDAVKRLTNDDLTTRRVDGTGTFDALMQAFNAHLRKEYDNNRITGEQYTKAYIALTEGAMGNATSFLLGKEAAYWQAASAQLQAQRAQVELITSRILMESEKTKLALIKFEAKNAQANYALSKMRLATESIQYCTAKYNLDEMLPLQKSILNKQLLQADEELLGLKARTAQTLEQTKSVVNENLLHDLRKEMLEKQNLKLVEELKLFPHQINLMKEQVETARAQTLDTRVDGTPIAGQVGKQRDLYSQQIVSYKRDGEMKAAKVFIDAWVTMKTIDEGLAPPTQFSNANLDIIPNTLKSNNGLTTSPTT